jgi:hypothetical protein
MTRRILGALAYIVPTFPLGYLWHLTIFADYYRSIDVYRDQPILPLGLASMVIQGIVWSLLYERLFSGESVLRGAAKFAGIAFPIAWSFMVLAVGAKHHMSSVRGFLLIETAFLLVQYAVTSTLIAAVYSKKPPDHNQT